MLRGMSSIRSGREAKTNLDACKQKANRRFL